jgi:hypothetical protein
MAFKLTYSDGHETDYDDNTHWEVEAGVLRLGREPGKWTVFLSPSHWATLELTAGGGDKDKDDDGHEDKHEDKDKHKDDHDKDKHDHDKDEGDKDNDTDDES